MALILDKIYPTSCANGMKEIEDKSIDLILTDPPYFQYRAQNVKGLKNHKDVVTEFEFDAFKTEKEYLDFLENILHDCFLKAKDGAAGYMFCSDDFVSYINRMVEKVGFNFRKVLHWHKTNPFPAISTRKMYANSMELVVHFSKGTPTVWNSKHVNEMHNYYNSAVSVKKIEALIKEFAAKPKELQTELLNMLSSTEPDCMIENAICMGKERTAHRTQKPLKILKHFIEISSNPGQLIFDPFMGSGSTAIAAKQLGRNFLGYEISEEYIAIIEKRLSEI